MKHIDLIKIEGEGYDHVFEDPELTSITFRSEGRITSHLLRLTVKPSIRVYTSRNTYQETYRLCHTWQPYMGNKKANYKLEIPLTSRLYTKTEFDAQDC